MTLNEIKLSFLGYNRNEICKYVSALNEMHSSEMDGIRDELNKTMEMYDKRCSESDAKVAELSEKVAELESKLCESERLNAEMRAENESVSAELAALRKDSEELISKREAISTAIINAEKCAGGMIEDADRRVRTMIENAEEKVESESRRLDVVKQYITELRASVSQTFRNIDNALLGSQTDIDAKKSSIDTDAKNTARGEKLRSIEKSFFKRA